MNNRLKLCPLFHRNNVHSVRAIILLTYETRRARFFFLHITINTLWGTQNAPLANRWVQFLANNGKRQGRSSIVAGQGVFSWCDKILAIAYWLPTLPYGGWASFGSAFRGGLVERADRVLTAVDTIGVIDGALFAWFVCYRRVLSSRNRLLCALGKWNLGYWRKNEWVA